MEHLRRLPNNNHSVGFPLGLPTPLSLPQKYRILERRHSNGRLFHAIELDADKQIPQITRPLHTISG